MDMKISEVLQDNIAMYELSINYIATQSGVPQSSLSRFCAGQHNLSMDSIDKLCEFFGLTLVKEIHWEAYAEEGWREYAEYAWIESAWKEHAEDAWKEHADDVWTEHVEEAWESALAAGDVDEEDYDEWVVDVYNEWQLEWEADAYSQWEADARIEWEEAELERLEAQPWVRIVHGEDEVS